MEQTTQNLPAVNEQKRRAIRKIPGWEALKPIQRAFLWAYSRPGMSIARAADKVGVVEATPHNWKKDEQFNQAFVIAKKMRADRVEDDYISIAEEGEDEPIIWKGQITGYYRKKNPDVMKKFLEAYKDNWRANFQVNQFAGPVQLNVKLAGDKQADPVVGATVVQPGDE